MNRERSGRSPAPPGRASCGHPPEIYWIKDAVWRDLVEAAGQQTVEFHPCLNCAEQFLGRQLTLWDLDIAGYSQSIPSKPELVAGFAKRMLVGAMLEAKVTLPEGWGLSPHPLLSDAVRQGKKFAQQTPDAEEALTQLVHEYRKAYP